MALIQITHVDVSQIVQLLARIADALDRAVPPVNTERTRKPAGPEALTVLTDDRLWQLQQKDAQAIRSHTSGDPNL